MTMMTPAEITPTTTTLTRGAVGGKQYALIQHTQSDTVHLHGGRGVVVGGILGDSVFTDEKQAVVDDSEEEDSTSS